MASFALVATVDEGARDDVAMRLRTVPPFELPLEGIDGHQVFLGAEHAAFVFWGGDPEGALVRVSGQSDVRERVAQAADGLRAPRMLEPVFDSGDMGHVSPAGCAVAVIARGADARPDTAGRAQALAAGLGALLERQRLFAGDGVALFVFERSEDAPAGAALPLDAIAEVAPIVPLRALEVLEQTYWFEAGDQLPPRPADGIVDAGDGASER
ncbi:MAG TPA: hypothetical protein VE777_06610 [Gaiellales bacterium]|jgi:hypothetical protein|nr:hypothetical protein [Gaiellales bacterium]